MMLIFSGCRHRSIKTVRGFSFLEIMLVVAIIGILVSLVSVNLVGQMSKSKITATKSQMNSIETALGMFEIDSGSYPTTEQGLMALVVRPSDLSEDEWSKYMKKLPQDAWRQDFIYRSPGENDSDFDLISMGKDKKEGTEDDIKLDAGDDEGDL